MNVCSAKISSAFTRFDVRFILYLIFLFLLSAGVANSYNIDLLAFWQKGHALALALTLLPTAWLLHSFFCLGFWGVLPLFFWWLFCQLQIFVLQLLKVRLSFGILSNICETDVSEASGFCTPEHILTTLFLLSFSLLCAGISRALLTQKRTKKLVLWLLLGLGTLGNFLLVPASPSLRESSLWPLNNIGEMAQLSWRYWAEERPLMQSLKELPSTDSCPVESSFSAEEELIIFLHIGESARADHWSLNGYRRPTTPFAQEAAKEGRLINFARTLSYGAGTRLSVVGLLTPASLGKPMPQWGPIFPLFKKQGFDLQAFRSNQKADDQIYDSTLITLTKDFTGKTHYEKGLAPQTLPALKEYLDKNPAPKKFIFYYGEGSHFPYEYEASSARFLPDKANIVQCSETPQEIVNRYDNTLVATDHFMREVTTLLKDKCALYVYVADHGEYLGEKGLYAHGNNVMSDPETRFVPFIFWTSPRFESIQKEKIKTLRQHAQNLSPVAHDHLFHTLMGLSSLSTPFYEKEKDLSSPDAQNSEPFLPEKLPTGQIFESLLPSKTP